MRGKQRPARKEQGRDGTGPDRTGPTRAHARTRFLGCAADESKTRTRKREAWDRGGRKIRSFAGEETGERGQMEGTDGGWRRTGDARTEVGEREGRVVGGRVRGVGVERGKGFFIRLAARSGC